MNIDVLVDVICPWCFVGKRRLESALSRGRPNGLTLVWRPFELNPDMPAEGMDRAAYLKAKFGDTAGGETYAKVSEAGKAEGIAFAFDRIKRAPNSLDAHRLIRFAQRHYRQDEVVEGLFRAYFIDGRDIGDRDTLVAIAGEQSLDTHATRAYLLGDEERSTVKMEADYARQVGITGVPCFIFDQKYAVPGAEDASVLRKVIDRLIHESAMAVAD
jgi:predicted DsbA family dithiol-disulfide isomerase